MALSMSAELCKHSAILPTRQSIQSNTRPTSLPLSNFLGRLHFQQTGPLSNPTRPIQQHFTLVRASAAGNGNSIGRFFKKVLNSTPIIGLLSNLTVDAGTPFVYYSQFGRQVADRASQETDEAFSDFEAIHGKVSCTFYTAWFIRPREMQCGRLCERLGLSGRFHVQDCCFQMRQHSKEIDALDTTATCSIAFPSPDTTLSLLKKKALQCRRGW